MAAILADARLSLQHGETAARSKDHFATTTACISTLTRCIHLTFA